MHAQLLVSVQEAGWLTIIVAEFEHSCVRRGQDGVCCGDVGGDCPTSSDSDTRGSSQELVLVQLHGICTSNESRGREGTGAAGVGPALVVGVVPVNDDGEAAGYTRSSTLDVPTTGCRDVARQAKIIEEGNIEVSGLGDARAREREDVRSVETLAVGLGLNVSRVHVVRDRVVAASPVQVDVTEERSS